MVCRVKVTNEQVPWDVEWKEYNPVIHSDTELIRESEQADPDLISL